ncbi:putative ABC transporter domain containing protein-like protein, partial [Dinothrombium tinctorium]
MHFRFSIWNHLQEISKKERMTIIVTTHYVEEASKADLQIGFLRRGRVLAEGRPLDLLKDYDQTTLELVFLHLCNRQSKFSTSLDVDDPIPKETRKRKLDSLDTFPKPPVQIMKHIRNLAQMEEIAQCNLTIEAYIVLVLIQKHMINIKRNLSKQLNTRLKKLSKNESIDNTTLKESTIIYRGDYS